MSERTATVPRTVAVMPRDGLSLWVCFADGESGEVDVSSLEVGGRWKTWQTRQLFENVRVDPESGYVYWGSWFDPCHSEHWVCLHPGWLYAKVSGAPVDDALVPPMPQWEEELPKPVEVEALDGLRIRVRFDDGAEGTADLSSAARRWPAQAWQDRQFFEAVSIDRLEPVVVWAWADDHFLYLDPDWLYTTVTRGRFKETWRSADTPEVLLYGGPEPPKPVEVEALDGLRIRVRFDDGAEGTADLSCHEGKGVWRPLADRQFFESVHLHPETNVVSWGDDFLDVCSDWLYMQITGKTLEEHMPGLALEAQALDA